MLLVRGRLLAAASWASPPTAGVFLTQTPPCLGLAFFAALALALALALAALTSWGLAADDDLGPEPIFVNVMGILSVQEMEE